jgi:hypothetical protein
MKHLNAEHKDSWHENSCTDCVCECGLQWGHTGEHTFISPGGASSAGVYVPHEDWEKELEKKFNTVIVPHVDSSNPHIKYKAYDGKYFEQVKPFMRSLLARQKEKSYEQGRKDERERIGKLLNGKIWEVMEANGDLLLLDSEINSDK